MVKRRGGGGEGGVVKAFSWGNFSVVPVNTRGLVEAMMAIILGKVFVVVCSCLVTIKSC